MMGLAHSGIPISTADRCVKIQNRPDRHDAAGVEPAALPAWRSER
jgi:hypothetical protein